MAYYIISGIMLFIVVVLALKEEARLKSRPNVVLIVVDTLRADRLGCYGHEANTSPTVDLMAAEGVVFENVYAQRSITWPSVTSIMSSQYPAQHGVRDNGEEQPQSLTTIGSVLGHKGYRTAAFLGNMTTANHPGYKEKFPVPNVPTNCERDAWITDRFIKWLHERRDSEPFMAWLHYMAPHKPYQPPREYEMMFDPDYNGKINGLPEVLDPITLNQVDLPARDVEHVRALYDACVRFTNDQIRRVLIALEESNLKDNTIIVFTSDHGEGLFERNHYFYHGCSMYDNCLHVPLIIVWEKKLPGKLAVKDVLESIDISPTILDLLSIETPSSFQGKSLLPFIEDNGSNSTLAYAEWQDKMATIRSDRWRYVWNPDNFRPDGNPYNYVEDERRFGYFIPPEALYDRVAEPTEENNLLGDYPSEVETMRKKLSQWKTSLPWTYYVGKKDEKSMEEIKSLGYINGGKGIN